MSDAYHYPPDLLQLLVDTIPLLCRSKKDVLLFFRGAGVDQQLFGDLAAQLTATPDAVNKYHIARTVLTRLNEPGDKTLRERREVLRRVVEFESFSSCWPNDQLSAQGLVAQIQKLVNVKDSFTRMNLERQKEAEKHRAAKNLEAGRAAMRLETLEKVQTAIGAAMTRPTAQERGRAFEAAITGLFNAYRILVREPFRVVSDTTGRVLEQIDGVVELDGDLYLVEVKWLTGNLDVDDVSRHLVRIYHRNSTRGLFISATHFTDAAEQLCKEALQKTVVALCLLEEIVELLDQRRDLAPFLRAKIRAAQIDKRPFVRLRPKT